MIPAIVLTFISVLLFALSVVAVLTGNALDIGRVGFHWIALTEDPPAYYWAALLSLWLGLGMGALGALAMMRHLKMQAMERSIRVRSRR